MQHVLRHLAVPLLVLTVLPAQEEAAAPVRATRALTSRDLGMRLHAADLDRVRVVERGAVRKLRPSESMSRAASLMVLQPDTEITIGEGPKALKTLPFKLQVVDGETLEIKEFRPVIQPLREALEFDGTTKAYRTEVLIGLVDSNGIGATTALPQALTLQLVTSLGKTVPTSLEIDHVGPPLGSVALSVTDEVPNVRLRVMWGAETIDSVECTFPLRRSTLQVEINPERIAGFGLEVADIVIRAPDAAQRGIKSVLVSHDRGRLEGTQQVILDEEGIGIAHLRSSGVGMARIRVTAPTFEAGEKGLSFHWPIAFVLFAIIGGVVGGFVRYIRGPHGRRKALLALLRSAFIGLVVAAGSAVGINLLGVQLVTGVGEAFVFVVAALGAMRGITLPGTPAAARGT